MIEIEKKSREAKKICANEDFDLLLQSGNIAFYKGCEVTQIFLFDKNQNKAKNYYTLFVFDEVDTIDLKANFLLQKPVKINKNIYLGIQQKRISLEFAKKNFSDIQNGKMNYDEECDISKQMVLLPKTYVPSLHLNDPALLNSVLKPNYWGDNYIIEFFDEEKKLFDSDGNTREKINDINIKINSVKEIKIDLSKVYDRIGNIIFQFPITILKSKIYAEKDFVNFRIVSHYHPDILTPKNLHIQMSASFDNVTTGFNATDTSALIPDFVLRVGDDTKLSTRIYDRGNGLILHDSQVNFLKGFILGGKIGMQYAEPRIIKSKDGNEAAIELFTRNILNTHEGNNNDYFERILKRERNSDIITQSGDYQIFKSKQRQEALNYIREKIKNSNKYIIKEICLWDPYLRAYDIMETLYFEDTGIPFRCITSYQNAKKLGGNSESFESFSQKERSCFENNSNNLRVTLKFLAQHDGYGWKFHDRFLILVPYDSTDLPEVYSLGTSVNIIGKNHHIIQKVTNPREILDNFEELWNLLDNGKCLVAEFK